MILFSNVTVKKDLVSTINSDKKKQSQIIKLTYQNLLEFISVNDLCILV